jgi:hypothetical protein
METARDHDLPLEPFSSELETPRPPLNAELSLLWRLNHTLDRHAFLSCLRVESRNYIRICLRSIFRLTLSETFRNFWRVRISSREIHAVGFCIVG